jgi:hypothetical protein
MIAALYSNLVCGVVVKVVKVMVRGTQWRCVVR